jgi:hypothetical protein
MRMGFPILVAAVITVWLAPGDGAAQDVRLNQLERRVQALEQGAEENGSLIRSATSYLYPGLGVLLMGTFCALWARGTRRDPWLWFVAGLLFNIFALFAILIKHEDDKKLKKAAQDSGTMG